LHRADGCCRNGARHPNRFGGFATLATQDPDAAQPIWSSVAELGLVGGLISGHCQGRYLADPAYEDLFACAESTGVITPPSRLGTCA
jgi:predicted TIM-barrel fold metal-dependent hydrolase